MKKNIEKLEDSYEDIKGACIDTLEENKNVLKMPINRAIAFYIHEFGYMIEDNEVENIVTLIAIGLFMVGNKFKNDELAKKIKYSINEIRSNQYDKFFFNKYDRELIDKDILVIESSNFLN